MNILKLYALAAAVFFLSVATTAQGAQFTQDDEVTRQCQENPDEIVRLETLREKMVQGIASLLAKKEQNVRLNLTEAEKLFQGEIRLNNLEAQLIARRYGMFLCEELERLKKTAVDPKTIT